MTVDTTQWLVGEKSWARSFAPAVRRESGEIRARLARAAGQRPMNRLSQLKSRSQVTPRIPAAQTFKAVARFKSGGTARDVNGANRVEKRHPGVLEEVPTSPLWDG